MSQQHYKRAQKRLRSALRARRMQLGLTQEEIAEALGMVARQYQKIEAGEVNLTLRSLVRIAEALGVAPRELL